MKKPTYIIKGPHKEPTRSKFSILKTIRGPEGKREPYKSIERSDLKAINNQYASGKLSMIEAYRHVCDVLAKMKMADEIKFPKQVFNQDNDNIFQSFWKKKYESLPKDEKLVDESSAKNDFKRALKCIGELNLRSASIEELLNRINTIPELSNRKRVVVRINSLLLHIGRKDDKIVLGKNKKRKTRQVNYLSHKDLPSLLLQLPVKLRLLVQTAFYSGLRIGEIFAITENSIQGNHLIVKNQLDRKLEMRGTKTQQERKAYILPEGRDVVLKWSLLPAKDKRTIRNLKYSSIIKSICKVCFPDDKEKHCTFHDLRHSYAIHLLSKGVSLTLVAQSLGNSISVAEEYYAGYCLSSDAIDSIENAIQKAANS